MKSDPVAQFQGEKEANATKWTEPKPVVSNLSAIL